MNQPTPIDPADPQFSSDPFPHYDRLRAAGPIAKAQLPNGTHAWFVTSTSMARQVLLDERFSARPPVKRRQSERAGLEDHMLNTDAPEHTRLRKLVARAFSNARIDALQPRIEAIIDELLDNVDRRAMEDPVFDIVDAFAFPLPVAVMCEVLGVPKADRHKLREWTFVVSAPRATTGSEVVAGAWTSLHDYFVSLIAAKREAPGDDLFSDLAQVSRQDDSLSEQELLSMAFLLLFAGYETTMNLVAGGLLTLATHREQLERCLQSEGTATWNDAVEELLRYVSPLEGATWRFTTEVVEIEGIQIPKGASVLVSLAAANHDAEQFSSPELFDCNRALNRHIAFGHGPHHCVGARLARLEARLALSKVFARYPALRIAEDERSVAWRPGLLVRGPRHLSVRVDDPLVPLQLKKQQREVAGVQRKLAYRSARSSVIDLASNDYLGLTDHPKVVEAAVAAARAWGVGATGSRLVTGSLELHYELETALAEHLGSESALVFSTGYAANLGAITALAASGDLIVSDSLNHASIIDACRLSRARVEVAPHRDAEAFAKLLAERSESHALAVSDAVFSVDGETAPLGALAAAARRTSSILVLDDAHGFGVVGRGGVGAVADSGLSGGRDVVTTATLSKALASQGGVVAAAGDVIDHITNTARPFIFDTGLSPANTAAALAALRQLQEQPELAETARTRALQLAELATQAGLCASVPTAAVCSVLIGTARDAVAARDLCQSMGVQVGCFRPPSVPDGVSRLRLTARASLTETDLVRVGLALAEVARQIPGARR